MKIIQCLANAMVNIGLFMAVFQLIILANISLLKLIVKGIAQIF